MFRFASQAMRELNMARPALINASSLRAFASKPPITIPPSTQSNTCKVVYDGSCPVCRLAVNNLKNPNVELIDARGQSETVKALEQEGYDLDKGMVVMDERGSVHFGPDAVKKMGDLKGGLSSYLSGSRLGSQIIDRVYPFFKAVRNSLIPESIADQRSREAISGTNANPEAKPPK